jgi:molybdenum cofactor biosynthesis enzyme MoaA
MVDSLIQTGFSEITQERVVYNGSDPWFIELAITGKCNFSCHYCNRFEANTDLSMLNSYFNSIGKARRIHITGGEPYLHNEFDHIVASCMQKTDALSISTNGSQPISKYLDTPADCFHISLDDYDLDVLVSRGYKEPNKVIDNIKTLSHSGKKVLIGMFLDSRNVSRANAIIDFILDLGVTDIKISTSLRLERKSFTLAIKENYLNYPTLNYRLNNFKNNLGMRGYLTSNKCYLLKSDVSIIGNYHYPCLVYGREKGTALGNLDDINVLEQRAAFQRSHNPLDDKICKNYCMDFKCDFNNYASTL